MRTRTKTALRTATGLVTVALAFHSVRANAQDDPFALPRAATQECAADDCAENPLLLAETPGADGDVYYAEVIVNGRPVPRPAALRGSGDALEIDSGFAFSEGIISALPDSLFIPLSAVEGLTHSFDPVRFTLSIEMPLYSTGSNLVSLAGPRGSSTAVSSNLTALIVDYDLSAQLAAGVSGFGGLIAPRLVRGNVALEGSALLNTGDAGPASGLTRLDTFLTIRAPERTLTATFGDFISQVPNGTRAVRMGGARLGTDFALRPDLITHPLPEFVDRVAVPTDLDVLVNDRRIGSVEVRPGEFTVRDIPVPVGRNEVGVVVRDALGRETIRTVQFYSSRALLAPGLREMAVNIGAIRRRYGRSSNDYGPLAASAMYRLGLDRRATGTVTSEISGQVQNFGIMGDVLIGHYGIFSLALRASRADYFATGTHSGRMIEMGFESVGRSLTYSLQYRDVSTHFADLASANGDAPSSSLLAANIGFDLRELGRVRVSAIRQARRDAADLAMAPRVTRVLAANYRHQIHRGINLSLDASHRRDEQTGRENFAFLVGLSVSLGGARFGQTSYTRSAGQDYLQAGYYSPDLVPGDTGYSVVAGVGATQRIAGSLSRREQWARMEAQAEIVGEVFAARMGIAGSLVMADGHVFASQRGSDTYVLADTNDVAGLEIHRENRPAGVTGNGGLLLIGDVPGYYRVKIGFEPDDVPVDVSVGSIEEFVTVAPRSVARVELDVTRYIPRRLMIVDPRGERLPAGTRAIAAPSGSEYLVGVDGRVEINDALEDTALEINVPGGEICRARIVDAMSTERGHEILRCYIRTRTFAFERPEPPPPGADNRPRPKSPHKSPLEQCCRRYLPFDRW